VNPLRTKLAFLVVLACQLAVLFGSFSQLSWWDGR
jgi:hypothetical protein